MTVPSCEKAFKAEGVETDIQNAQNDTSKYATIAQQQLTKGCQVMLLVDLNKAGVQVAEKAKAQGVPVIAYDRPIAGADYYISFDNFEVGKLQGQMIVDGLKAAGKDPASAKVVYVGGDPTDGNAKQFHDGADEVMAAAGIKPAFETPGSWDPPKVLTYFEQAYTATKGDIDAVWVANDFNAASVISVLDKNGKKVPVSGQDASPPGLQNILLGKQTATVYKPFQLEAQAARGPVHEAAQRREAGGSGQGGRRHAVHPADPDRGHRREHEGRVRRRQREGRGGLHQGGQAVVRQGGHLVAQPVHRSQFGHGGHASRAEGAWPPTSCRE